MDQENEAHTAGQLVARIIQGDATAEYELVVRYQRGLLFILRRQCNQDEALAADLVQETWSIVLSKIRQQKLREPTKLGAFIVQTGKNLAIAHFRKSENTRGKFTQASSDTSIADPALDPESVLERYNLGLMVRQVILELEQRRDRELMFRFFVNEQEKKHICTELELDANHFDRVLYRAKQRFRQIWQQFEDTS